MSGVVKSVDDESVVPDNGIPMVSSADEETVVRSADDGPVAGSADDES